MLSEQRRAMDSRDTVIWQRIYRAIALVVTVLSCAGCPPGAVPPIDGGRTCSNVAECNPSGATCGVIVDCVLGYCATSTIVRACADGGGLGSDAGGDTCFVSEDCNPPGACGPIIACVNYQCDRGGPRITVPCVSDAGMSSVDANPGADSSSDVAAQDASGDN
ncbi:MAG: hypothetical protein Q8Q09_15530 [Deltaproteobacteria bacterium]|nr:hypothetical protein [Deltaproteobacteria bacterium]